MSFTGSHVKTIGWHSRQNNSRRNRVTLTKQLTRKGENKSLNVLHLFTLFISDCLKNKYMSCYSFSIGIEY